MSPDAARPAGQPTPLEPIVERRVRLLSELGFQLIDKSAAYEQVIVGAGYLGFFALWVPLAPELDSRMRAWIVVPMGVSVILYIAFHVVQMTVRAVSHHRLVEALAEVPTADFENLWEQEAHKANRAMAKILIVWPPVLVGCVVTGLLGGVLLVISAVQLAVS